MDDKAEYRLSRKETDTEGTFTVSGPGVHHPVIGLISGAQQLLLLELLTNAYEAGKKRRSTEILVLLGGRR